MKKIILLDNRGRFHVFAGSKVAFHTGPEGCEIMDYNRARDKKIAHFAQYQWVKEEEAEGPQGRDAEFISHDEADQIPESFTPPQPHAPDPFTAKALAERDTPVLDHGSLAPGAPIEMTATQVQERTEQWAKDTAAKIEAAVPQLSPDEQQESFESLKEQYGTSPLMAVLADVDKVNKEAAEIMEDVNPPQITDKGPVIDEAAEISEEAIQATLDQAEVNFKAKQAAKEKPACETCGGSGTVPDDESNDPLDTRMCPDC